MTRKASPTFAIVIIALVLFIVPWIIGKLVPPMTESGYTVRNNCVFLYELFVSSAVVLSILSNVASHLLIKGPSRWKVFVLFEIVVLVSTGLAIFLTYVACTFNPTNF